MKKDYKSLYQISWKEKKQYLLEVCLDEDLHELFYSCMTHRQLKSLLGCKTITNIVYSDALNALYHVDDFYTMEYHLIMMNSLFNSDSYETVKSELLTRICVKPVDLQKYCVIRHLIDFKALNFEKLMETLQVHFATSDEECAKICLIENEYDLAFHYMMKLDNLENEAMLELMHSFSTTYYLLLKNHYASSVPNYNYQLAFS
ncbi:MAG: hypothetical protein LUG46_02510 [Erysipelotrichaceae bacterium]|nr:hypothetical protein [Erysipelotrichaceae bacterium]